MTFVLRVSSIFARTQQSSARTSRCMVKQCGNTRYYEFNAFVSRCSKNHKKYFVARILRMFDLRIGSMGSGRQSCQTCVSTGHGQQTRLMESSSRYVSDMCSTNVPNRCAQKMCGVDKPSQRGKRSCQTSVLNSCCKRALARTELAHLFAANQNC